MSGTNGLLPSISANESFSVDSEVAKRFCQENKELCEICALLAYNKTYIELLDELIAKVDEAVTQNRNAQKMIRNKLLHPGGKSEKSQKGREFGLRYRYPYFRDASGMVPAQNMEALDLSRACSFNPLTDEEKKWTEKELRMLKEAVAQSLNEQHIIKLDAKKDVVTRKLRAAGVETTDEKMEKWRVELERITNRATYIRCRPVDEVVQEANGDFGLVDWAKIAASVFQGSRSIIQLKQKWFSDMLFNQEPWTIEEDETLMSLAADMSNWDSIAKHLNTDRSAFRCFQRHVYLREQFLKEKKPWSPEEDDKLLSYIHLFKIGQEIPWGKVSMYLDGRSKKACEHRYVRSLNESLRHGRWSEEEDLMLLHTINKYGPQNWTKIATFVYGRSALQCRDRWIHVLDHKRRDLPWGWEEHQRLLYGVELFGRSECAKIAKLLPGRNNMDVRMRIRLLVKYKIQETDPKKKVIFRHFADNYLCCKMRRTFVVDKFKHYLEVERQDQINKNQLHSRLGLGTFVAESADYTDVKKERLEKFGKWSVMASGRWIKLLVKNPNEYNNEDLLEELDKLPEEKRSEALEWLRKSDKRLEQERQMEQTIPDDPAEAKDFYERMYPKERLKELSELVGKLLKPTPNDIAYYNRTKKRPGKLRLAKEKGTLKRKPRQRPKRRKKAIDQILTKLSSNDAEDAMDIDVNGMRWSDRMIVEIDNAIKGLPKRKRREYVIRSLCNASRQRIHQRNVSLLKSTPNYREYVKNLVYDYVEKVVNDPLVPSVPANDSPVLPPVPATQLKLNKEKMIRLPQNWHNLSLKEMMKLKVAPHVFPSLVQQATLAEKQLSTDDNQQRDIEVPMATWGKRRRLEAQNMEQTFSVVFGDNVECAKREQQAEMYKQILSKLVPPLPGTINALEMFESRERARLAKLALVPFDEHNVKETENPSTSRERTLPQRRVVPENVRQSPEYECLRRWVFRLFFLPLLMQHATRNSDDANVNAKSDT